jgi:hypothetical protein
MRLRLTLALFGALLLVAACRPAPGKPALPATAGQPLTAATPRPTLALATPAAPPPLLLDAAPALVVQPPPAAGQPTLADFWAGRARFVVDVADTGLPMGESDTVAMSNGELWSFVHASDRSAGVVDSCGAAVEFPGCLVIYRSVDGGVTFTLPGSPPVCQIPCRQCPCPEDEHVRQQQYPRVYFDGDLLTLVYEYLGRVMVRRSPDTVTWTPAEHVADTTIWHLWFRDCVAAERIGRHPFAPFDYECLAGGPPGLYIEDDTLFVFTALGQNPSAMGCFFAPADGAGPEFRRCAHNPLFVGAASYGPEDVTDAAANAHFDFRTISSAEVVKVGAGEAARYYMLYEGVRGPGPGDPGDTQFGVGLARSLTAHIDGPWEKFPGNPLFVDLPGNIGLGHADLVVIDGRTYLYTALDGVTRSRLTLQWVDS